MTVRMEVTKILDTHLVIGLTAHISNFLQSLEALAVSACLFPVYLNEKCKRKTYQSRVVCFCYIQFTNAS